MSIFYYLSKKCKILFKNLLLNLPFFIYGKKKFFKNLVFLTDTVADLAKRYTLCAHCSKTYAHCIGSLYRLNKSLGLWVRDKATSGATVCGLPPLH